MTKIRNAVRCTFLLTFFLINLSSYASAKDQIPLEFFVREPAWTNVEISPDGTKLLSIMGEKEISSLVTYEIAKRKFNVILKGTNSDWNFAWGKWLDNEHFMVGARVDTQWSGYRLYLDQQYIGHYSGKKFERLIDPNHKLYPLNNIVNWLENDPDHILISSIGTSKGPAIFSYNINKHRLNPTENKPSVSYSKVIAYSDNSTNWVSDSTGRYFSGISYDKDVRNIFLRDSLKNTQSLLWTYSVLDFESVESHPKFIQPLGFEPGKPILYISGLHENRWAIYKIDLSNENKHFTLVAKNDRYDLNGQLIFSAKDGRPVGIYHNYDGLSATYWDNSFSALKNGIDKSLPGSNAIVSVSLDETKYVVLHTASNYPGAYFIGDRTNKSLDYIGSWYPELMEAELPKREKFEIKARDGLELEVFVTLPNQTSKELSPVVVIPHSGPFGKNTETFDLIPAFLADRGYTVLQVNYRGSGGYGLDFLLKSRKNYGLAVQDDIEDATLWLIENRKVDATRICIMGKEFGGYSALMGLANKPELYKCGVSFSGITDLIDWSTHNIFVYGYSESFLGAFFGGRWADRTQLKESSPINLTDKIDQPLLILHGRRDINVPVEQSDKLYKKLKNRNKLVRYIRFKDGYHDLKNYSYRKQYFEEVEIFLMKYL